MKKLKKKLYDEYLERQKGGKGTLSGLKKLRDRIDRIDEEILVLLNKRAKIVVDVARLKRKENASFYSPQR
ncbi:MAG: chorismate mutase, partial [Nitrospirae bacterium]|nr:chorismate mutase [Nitrospirota bacterium]